MKLFSHKLSVKINRCIEFLHIWLSFSDILLTPEQHCVVLRLSQLTSIVNIHDIKHDVNILLLMIILYNIVVVH